VRGGAQAALLTGFDDTREALFASPPGCVFDHQASSYAMGRYRGWEREGQGGLVPKEDFDFFPFPGREVSVASADLAGMFRDTPQARALIKFLAGAEGQRIWPELSDGTVFSVNRDVTDVYDDPVGSRIAGRLTTQSLCFDASDLMPARMTDAFHRAVLAYLDAPGRLEALLTDLERVRQDLVAEGQWVDIPCGQ
jgi:alpha-glucoside transport system substrate-binding protein